MATTEAATSGGLYDMSRFLQEPHPFARTPVSPRLSLEKPLGLAILGCKDLYEIFIKTFSWLSKSPSFQGSILAYFIRAFERFRDFGLFYKGF